MDKIAIVGWDVLSDKEDAMLSDLMEVIGADRESCQYFCCNPEGKNPDDLKLKEQKELVQEAMTSIKFLGFKGAVILGDYVARLAGKTNFKKVVGKIATEDTLPCPTMITYTIGEVIKNPKLLYIIAKDIMKAYEVATDTFDDSVPTKWKMITTMDGLLQLIGYIKATKHCCFDFETTKIEPKLVTFHPDFKATLLAISFQHGSSYLIPLEHFNTPIPYELMVEMLDKLKVEVFENPEITKIAHNLSFDAHVLRHYGIGLEGRLDDTMFMHHLVDETLGHGLKDLVAYYFPQFAGYDGDLAGMDWGKIPLGLLCKYAAIDSDMTFRLKTILESLLMEDERSYIIYRNVTMAGWKALFKMESNGMIIDRQYLEEAQPEVVELIASVQDRLKTHPMMTRYQNYKRKEVTQNTIEEKQEKLRLAKEKSEATYNAGIDKLNTELEALRLKTPVTKGVENSIASREAKLKLPRKKTANELKYEKEIQDIKLGNVDVYGEFNFASTTQLTDLLYDSPLGFNFNSLEKGTGKDVLEGLAEVADEQANRGKTLRKENREGTVSKFMEDLLLMRTLEKTNGTYLTGILDRLDSTDRLHASFLLNGTKSGRLSSKNPNLQNMPNAGKLKNEEAIKVVSHVKRAFISMDGYTLVQLDYSQAELRTIAYFAKEEAMLEAYRNDMDLHILTASVVLGISVDQFMQLPKEEQRAGRQKAKAVNFGLIYGMGAEGFMHYAKTTYGVILTLEESTTIRDAFFAKYPMLKEYHKEYIAKGRKFGWVRTFFGRRRRLPNINSDNRMERGMDERVATNSPIQGTAGEFTVFSLALLLHRLDSRVLLANTIHDSIILYIPDDILDEQIRIAVETASNLPMLQYFNREMSGISMKVDAEASTENWKSLKEYKIN